MLKRILLLLLALACVLAMVACDDKKESSSKKDDDDEDESVEITVSDDADSDITEASSEESVPAPEISVEDADAAIKAFFDALVQLDATGLKDACHDSEIFYSESFLEFEKICSGDFGEMLGDDAAMFAGHEEKLGEMVQAIIDKLSQTMSYQLSEGRRIGNDTVVYDVEMTMFNADQIGTIMTEQLSNALSEQVVIQLVTELMSNGTITNSTTEEELYEILIPVILDMVIDAIRNMELTSQTISGEFAVIEKDGVLLVDLDYEETPGIFV